MEPIKDAPKTVLGFIEEVDRIRQIAEKDIAIAITLKSRLYVYALKVIASRSRDEYCRDVATEVLNLEEIS